MPTIRLAAIATSVAFLGFVADECRAAPQYNIIALDVLPGGVDSYATAISESGVVVGHSTLDRSGNVGRSRPVTWDITGQPTPLWEHQEETMCDISTGQCVGPTPGAIPFGVNSAGQVVGRYGFGSGVPFPVIGVPQGRAFIWDAVNGMQDLGSLGGTRIEAVAINEQGQVAGTSSTGRIDVEGTVEEAFLWDATNGMQSLGTLGGSFSRASAINNLGEVVGASWLANFSEGAFVWDSVQGIRDLGSISNQTTRARAMNDVSEVAGVDWGIGSVLWDRGRDILVPIEPNPSFWVFDINNHGEIVGYVTVPGESRIEAIVWSSEMGLLSLNSLLLDNSGWNLTEATAINDRGQIAGYGWLDDQIRGFLITPVPEPSGFVSALGAAVAIWCWQRLYASRTQKCSSES